MPPSPSSARVRPSQTIPTPNNWSSAKAAIDAGAATGAVDPKRVGVMGFLWRLHDCEPVAHSDLFRAGIARSGAYNRTLTPFGFQNEERTYWQAPKIDYKMSPFSFADKIKTPILLIHGEADNNTGTYPIQSERFYDALKGEGATVRFVLLPLEAHGYRAGKASCTCSGRWKIGWIST